MKTNVATKRHGPVTHEGGPAYINKDATLQLRRLVSACFLFENQYYESGQDVAARIHEVAARVETSALIDEMKRAKELMGLRHAPLWLALELLKRPGSDTIGNAVASIITRVDEIPEIVALYQMGQRSKPLSKQLKRALRMAFNKFDQYQFSKYDRDGLYNVRDVMFLVHPKPADDEHKAIFKMLANQTLPPAETWEVALSGIGTQPGMTPDERKQARVLAWSGLLTRNKIGALALLRNLRNMSADGIPGALVTDALRTAKLGYKIFPHQIYAAWKNAPNYSSQLNMLLRRALESFPTMGGTTVLLVDVSDSMNQKISGRSEMSRMESASMLALMIGQMCSGNVQLYTFSNNLVQVPFEPAFSMIDRIKQSQHNSGTDFGSAVDAMVMRGMFNGVDRFIVITDEQARNSPTKTVTVPNKYVVNVGTDEAGIRCTKNWRHIDGFSNAVPEWIVGEELHPLFTETDN